MKFVSSIACSLFFAALAHAGDPVNARYVRVELSGGGKQLTLAEVEVMVGKKKRRPCWKSQAIFYGSQWRCRPRN